MICYLFWPQLSVVDCLDKALNFLFKLFKFLHVNFLILNSRLLGIPNTHLFESFFKYPIFKTFNGDKTACKSMHRQFPNS